MLMMVILDVVIITVVVQTILHKLPVRLKIIVYKIPLWITSFVVDFLLMMPAASFQFGAVGALLAEPIIYYLLVIDKRLTMRYVAYSIGKYGDILSKDEIRERKKQARKQQESNRRNDKRWYDIFLHKEG